MSSRTQLALAFSWAFGLAFASAAIASDVAVQKVLTGLQAPCGVAVRPESGAAPYEVFVADRGAGRVVKLLSAKPDASTDVITGLPTPKPTDEASVSPGIRSLLFLDPARLVVAGCNEDKTALLRLYDLSESTAPLKADEEKQSVDLPAIGDDSKADHRSFHSLARTQPNDKVADMLLIAAYGEHDSAGLWKVSLRANTLGEVTAFPFAKSNDEAFAVGGIAATNRGYIVLAGGLTADPGKAGVLKFLSPADGRIALQINTELSQIVGLAYCPTSGNLYAANSPSSGKQGAGVYRIDAAGQLGKPATAVKIANVARPTALAFGPDGALYVTALEESSNDGDKGVLLKLTGEL